MIRHLLKKIFQRDNIFQIARYGSVTAVSYAVLTGGTFIAAQNGINPQWSYPILLALTYIGVYIAYTRFVFKVRSSRKNAVKFIATFALSWIANNIFFVILYTIYGLPYITVITANLAILGGLRFIIQKHVVFTDNN